MKRGSIWWVEFDPSVGTEINKTRPAVIVSNDIANQHRARVVVVPLTSNVSRVYPGEALVIVESKKNKAMTDQIMSADISDSPMSPLFFRFFNAKINNIDNIIPNIFMPCFGEI